MNCTKERPILFNAEMVRAILDGRKTQTRRVAKLDPRMMEDEAADWCPHGKPDDRLWVRETWRCFGGREYEYQQEQSAIIYKADADAKPPNYGIGEEWRPSIFMPRWASRLTLEIAAVRVERLQDISEEDAKAEGVPEEKYAVHYYCDEGDPNDPEDFGQHRCNWRFGYKMLWDSINGKKYPWESNPWVWVVSFKPIGHYLEALRRAAQ